VRITEEEARHAGELTRKIDRWTDEDLALIIKTDKLVIAYLEGKGQGWQLALSPLWKELNVFKSFVVARKRDREENARKS